MTTTSPPPNRRRRLKGVALAVATLASLGGLVTVATPASADPPAPIVVNTTDFTGTGSLSEAIDTVNTNADEDGAAIDIQVQGTIDIPADSALTISAPVAVTHSTGTSGDLTLDAHDATRIFTMSAAGTVSVEGVTLLDGNAGSVDGGVGGSIRGSGTGLTLTDVAISSSQTTASSRSGGAISWSGGSLTLDHVAITGSAATGGGGGIYMSGGTLTITDSSFTSNTSGATAAREGGGAISAPGASISIIRTSFSNNETTGDGGAVYGDGSSTQITSSTFDSNSSSRFGGAIALVNATLDLKGSRLTGNFALSGGGALRTYDVAATVAGSVIRNNNAAAGDGGGIEVFTDDAEGSLEVEASTIVGNGQSGSQVHGTSIPSVQMADTIVSNAATGEDFDVTADTFDVHHSLIQDPSAGSTAALTGHANVLGASPQLSFSDGSPRPSASGPAVDAGDPSFLTTTLGLTTDIRGRPRVSGDAIDMGAVELQYASTPTVDLQGDDDTGSSQTDDVTKDPSPVFDITGVAGLTVELHRGDDMVDYGTDIQTLHDANDVEGVFAYVALVYGEVGDPVISAPLTVTRDHTAPDAPDVPDLDASTDLGTSATDNFTSATTRTFDLSGAEPTATLTLRQAYTYQQCIQVFPPPFPPMCFQPTTQYDLHSRDEAGDGTVEESHDPGTTLSATYDAMQTDLAGNSSGYSSSALTVTFDFTAPSVPNAPDLQAASDDGTSTTDNSTTKTALTFDVTGVDPGATATLARVDGQSGDEVDTRPGDGPMTDAGPVATGSHTYVVAVMDAAGNTSVDPTGLAVTVVAVTPPTTTPPPSFVPQPTTTAPSSTTTTAPPSTTPTTDAPPPPTASAKASDSTPNPGDTIKLDTAPPSGGSTSSTLDSTKPSTAILLSTSGGTDQPMPQPVITKNADGSVSISVKVPADTPPGVYLIAVMGTTPSGESRVIIVPIVVRRTGATVPARASAVRAASVPTAAVPAVARSIQASVAALGGSAAVERAVVEHGATLSIAGDQLVVDSHPAGRDSPVGPAALVGLLLGAVALFRTSTRRFRSIR